MSRTAERRQLAREVNNRIREIQESFGAGDHEYELICECGTHGCVERIVAPRNVYEETLATCRHLVAPGHEESDEQGFGVVVARLLRSTPPLRATG